MKISTRGVGGAHPFTLAAGLVDLVADGLPNKALELGRWAWQVRRGCRARCELLSLTGG